MVEQIRSNKVKDFSMYIIPYNVQFVPFSLLNAPVAGVTAAVTHVGIPRPRDTTELNNDGMIKSGDVHYETGPNLSIFSKINDSSFCSHILLAIDLQCHAFPFGELCL